MARALLVFGSAVLYGLAFPPYDYWPLVWFALTPLLAVLHRCRGPAGALLWGALWALTMTLVVGNCLVPAVEIFYGRSALLGWLLLAGAGILTAVPQYAAFAAVYWLLANRWRAGLPLFGAAAWAAAEWARTALPPGNPWAISGYAPTDFPIFLQIADLGGAPAVSFVIAAVNIAIVLAWQTRARHPARRRAAWLGAMSAVAIVTFTLVYGGLRMAGSARGGSPPDGVMVAAVQPGGGPRIMPGAEAGRAALVRSIALSSEAIRDVEPKVIFWPESSLAFYPEEDALYRRSLPASLPSPIPEIVAGGPRLLGPKAVANAVFVIAPSGEITSSYDKQVLLPLGESFPAGLDGLIRRDLGEGPRAYTPGSEPDLLQTAAGRVGVAICNETMVPSLIRHRVAMGADFLLNPTNDTWFPDAACPRGLLKIARLRAIEERRWLIRASSSGPSAIIDPWGRLVASTQAGDSTWIAARIGAGRSQTMYGRTHGYFGALCLAVALAGTLLAARRSEP